MKLSNLKENPLNPRILKDDRLKKLCKSIRNFPKMMELRPIVIDENNIIQGGNQRFKALKELGYTEIPDNWVKQGNEFTPEQWREFMIRDNVNFGEFDWDILANEWSEPVEDWGVEPPKAKGEIQEKEDSYEEQENISEKMVEDCIYPSNNLYDIPTLLLEKQALNIIVPMAPWGADSRLRRDVATYHFYVDDYRFEALFKDPVKLLTSGCKQIVEPNLSLYDTTPLAYGLHLIYKKRWLSRYLQECNIKVYADLNVSKKFYEFNQMGIPEGYNAFSTRGYSDRLEYLKMEIEIARKISGVNTPNLIVYGGGAKVKEVCVKNNLLYVEQFINDK